VTIRRVLITVRDVWCRPCQVVRVGRGHVVQSRACMCSNGDLPHLACRRRPRLLPVATTDILVTETKTEIKTCRKVKKKITLQRRNWKRFYCKSKIIIIIIIINENDRKTSTTPNSIRQCHSSDISKKHNMYTCS